MVSFIDQNYMTLLERLSKMGLFKDIITQKSASGASSKRFVLVIAGISLSLAVLVLSAAAAYDIDVAAELWAVTTTLAALAGVSYVGKKEGPPTTELPPNQHSKTDEEAR